MSEADLDHDYRLTEEQMLPLRTFASGLSMLSGKLAAILIEAGLTRAQALNVVTCILIDCAAESACRTRRHVLGGEPDPERWRAVTDKAFENAIKRTKEEKSAP